MVLTLKTRKFSLGLSLVNSFEAGPYNGLLSRIGALLTSTYFKKTIYLLTFLKTVLLTVLAQTASKEERTYILDFILIVQEPNYT